MTRPPVPRPDADGLADLRALVAFHSDPRLNSRSEAAYAEPPGSATAFTGTVVPLRAGRDDAATLAPAPLPPDDELLDDETAPSVVEPAAAEPAGDETADETADEPADEPADDEPAGDDTEDDELAAGDEVASYEPPDPDVADLVQRAQGGDADAFGLLYDRYVDLVYRFVYYRVGSAPLAEDLVSETFLRALRRIGSFSWQGRDFAAWLVTIARNLVADHFKSGRYRLEITTAEMIDADRVSESPENEVLDGITNAVLIDSVRRLNPEQQECLALRFLHGMSVLETALAMGKTEGAIKALQFRAVRSLARLLPKEYVR